MNGSQDPHAQALALFQAGRFEEAARVLEELLKTQESGEIWNDWATAQLMCGRISEGERGYRRALELDPDNCSASGNLGALLGRSGRIAEALPFLGRAAETSKGSERDQLLSLIRNYRAQLGSGPQQDAGEKNLLAQMADAIHQQSVAIAALAKRITALEERPTKASGIDIPAPPPDQHPGAANSLSDGQDYAPAVETTPRSKPKPGILFCGSIYDATGYSEESWTAALALAERHIPLQLAASDEGKRHKRLIPQDANEKLIALMRQRVDIPASIIYQAAPPHGWDMNLFGRRRVGRTMYETDRIPESFREHCNAMDETWVPSRFNMETFAVGGVNPNKLRFVPGGVDTKVFKPGVEPLCIPKSRSFNFVSVFDWQDRKGYDILLRAYIREFRADDDVALILKVYQMAQAAENPTDVIVRSIEKDAGMTLEKAPTIVLLNGFMTQTDLIRLYSAAHCFVLPTHGEGYGRPFLEALGCGLPVIATGWGGQMDFLNESNSYLIESKLTEVPKDVVVNISAGHRWAQPEEGHLRALMRQVYSHPVEARSKAQRGLEDVRAQYDWKVVAPLWVDEFRRLLN
ncbi:MAG: glycosyltransferase [Acidobacteriota bacterium]|nr:glycosyltransferase [Acidobacteriota bacterium]